MGLEEHTKMGGDQVRFLTTRWSLIEGVADHDKDEDRALIGGVQTVEDVHQGRLTGAVLAEQAVDLTGLHDEVDVIVGDETAEPLRDATEFELHGFDPS